MSRYNEIKGNYEGNKRTFSKDFTSRDFIISLTEAEKLLLSIFLFYLRVFGG